MLGQYELVQARHASWSGKGGWLNTLVQALGERARGGCAGGWAGPQHAGQRTAVRLPRQLLPHVLRLRLLDRPQAWTCRKTCKYWPT